MAKKPVVIREYERLSAGVVGARAWRQLRNLDEARARRGLAPVLDWSRRDFARAQSLVGVVETDDVVLEVLPKIDSADGPTAAANLSFMLALAHRTVTHPTGAAGIRTESKDLLEALFRPFLSSLIDELVKGRQHEYRQTEDELGYLRGRLLVAREIRRLPWQRQRMSVEFDEYDQDTLLNRTFRAACQIIAASVRGAETTSLVLRCLDELEGVSDVTPTSVQLSNYRFNRTTRRFAPLFEFARSIIDEGLPDVRAGRTPGFAIVFPMETLFEEFVARAIRIHAKPLGLARSAVHAQARGRRRWLLEREPDGRGVLHLRPDIVIDGPGTSVRTVVDTKWKRLLPDAASRSNGVSESDLYQIVSYAARYGCEDAVLVYPRVAGVTDKVMHVPGFEGSIRIVTIDVSGDLRANRPKLIADLGKIVGPGQPAESAA